MGGPSGCLPGISLVGWGYKRMREWVVHCCSASTSWWKGLMEETSGVSSNCSKGNAQSTLKWAQSPKDHFTRRHAEGRRRKAACWRRRTATYMISPPGSLVRYQISDAIRNQMQWDAVRYHQAQAQGQLCTVLLGSTNKFIIYNYFRTNL